MSIYTDNGYDTRTDYLENLAEEYNTTYGIVKMLADTLGKNEDFDALPLYIEDYLDTCSFLNEVEDIYGLDGLNDLEDLKELI